MKWIFQPDSQRWRAVCIVSAVALGIVVLIVYVMMSSQSWPAEDDERSLLDVSVAASGMNSPDPNGCEMFNSVVAPSYDPTVLNHKSSSELQVGSVLGPYQILAQRLDEAFRVHDAADVTQMLGERRVLDPRLLSYDQEPFPSIEAWMSALRAVGESIAISEAGRAQEILILGTRHGNSDQPQPISIAVDLTGDCSMTVHSYHHQEQARMGHIAAWTDVGLLMFGGQQYGTGATDDITKHRPSGAITTMMPENQRLFGRSIVQITSVPWLIDNNENDLLEMQALWTDERLMVVAAIESGIAVLTYDVAMARWERSAALPGPQQAVGGVVWTGRELLMVGGGPFEPSQAAWLYEPDVDGWERVDDVPIGPVEGLHGIMGDGVAYFGGAERDFVPPQGEVVAYDLALQKWEVIPLPISTEGLPYRAHSNHDLPHANLQSSSPLAGRDEYRQLLWTGSELVYFYVTLGEHAAATFAEPCRDHAAAYVMTESGDLENAASSVLLFYDPEQDSWRKSTPMPADHSINRTLAWTGTHVVLWGGKSSVTHLGCEGHVSVRQGYLYDVAADQWRPMSPSPLGPRCGHSTTWTGSRIIIFGGTPSCDGNSLALSDGAIYDPSIGSWASFRVESRMNGDS